MNNLIETIAGVATAIVGVALLAVLVSKNAQTPQVISSAGSAFSAALNAATGPVSGTAGLGGSSLGNETIGPGYY